MGAPLPGELLLGYKVTKIFILLSTIILVTSIPSNLTGDQLQPTDSELIRVTCGSVCEYEEWFSRAHCDDRGLTYVPSCTGCEGATLLELQENNIHSIPPQWIAEYYHVRTLDVSWNQISILDPGTFFQLHDLKNIICSHNVLQIIQNGLLNGTEQNLARIYLNNNKIHTIGDKAFENLNQLIAMYLNNNHIQSLPQNVFSDVTNIRYLILSDNDLDYVEKSHFKGLTKLEYLSLDANNLKTIPEGLFTGLESLKEVLLSHNKLITIPAPNHLGLPLNLERLDLRNNLLNLSTVIFPHLINATWTINLNDNPIPCDCFFQSIQDALMKKPNSQTTMTCTFPNGSVHSISDYLPITCSEIHNKNSSVIHYTTVLPTTSTYERNDRLVTLDQQNNKSFMPSKDYKNLAEDQAKQVTAVADIYCALNIATLVILVIFFALWLGNSTYFGVRYIKRQKVKDKNGQSRRIFLNGKSSRNGSMAENQPLRPSKNKKQVIVQTL